MINVALSEGLHQVADTVETFADRLLQIGQCLGQIPEHPPLEGLVVGQDTGAFRNLCEQLFRQFATRVARYSKWTGSLSGVTCRCREYWKGIFWYGRVPSKRGSGVSKVSKSR